MKRLLAPLRGTAAVLTASIALTGAVAYGAPKKTESATAVQPAPAPEPAPQKKSILSKLGFKKKEQPAAEVPAPKPAPVPATAAAKKTSAPPKAKAVPSPAPAPATAAAAKKSPAPATAKAKTNKEAKSAPVEQPVVQAEPPQKKGWFKGLFSKSKSEAPAEPQLAKAKTAKPAPVKDAKPAAKPDAPATAEQSAPKEKRGLFGFIRRLREPNNTIDASAIQGGRIERPADWQDHKIVSENNVAIYSFGPMQANGPDRRLETGTPVKVKSVRRGWALVEVEGGFAGYIDASTLRDAQKGDFKDPPPPTMMASAGTPDYWAPLAPPPDLPDQPTKTDAESALLLLPPLELEPKPNP